VFVFAFHKESVLEHVVAAGVDAADVVADSDDEKDE
jgi:hypothetical protein